MTELNTRIARVTVYPDRARVTRTGRVRLEAGEHHLEIPHLPLTLDVKSVRAGARSTVQARLLGVDVARTIYAETPTEKVRELEKKVETAEDEIKAMDAHIALLTDERASLKGLAQATDIYARGMAYGKTTPADQISLLDHLRQRAGEVDQALLQQSIERRELERRLEALRKQLDLLRSGRRRERFTATIEVEMAEDGELEVELTYVVPNAGWVPLYDLRLLEGEKPALEVGYLAQVGQRTGEEWDGVSLTLSTARPALAGTVPELAPWTIGPVQPRPPAAQKRAAKLTTGAAAPPPAPAAERSVADVEAQVVTAQVQESGSAITYVIPAPATILPDGTSRKVTVARFRLSPRLDYVTAPKIVEAVYRRATVDNDSPYTLLAGPASLFVGDEFIGSTDLELTPPNGEIELYLGSDERLKVERELERREVDKRLIGDRRRIRYGYKITLTNPTQSNVKITVEDQIPVSRHEGIKIRLESADPKPTEQTELGILRWELDLAPGEEKGIRFDFAVEHPRDIAVSGLP